MMEITKEQKFKLMDDKTTICHLILSIQAGDKESAKKVLAESDWSETKKSAIINQLHDEGIISDLYFLAICPIKVDLFASKEYRVLATGKKDKASLEEMADMLLDAADKESGLQGNIGAGKYDMAAVAARLLIGEDVLKPRSK